MQKFSVTKHKDNIPVGQPDSCEADIGYFCEIITFYFELMSRLCRLSEPSGA